MLIPHMSPQRVFAAAHYIALGACVCLLSMRCIFVPPDVASAAERTTAHVARAAFFLLPGLSRLGPLRPRAVAGRRGVQLLRFERFRREVHGVLFALPSRLGVHFAASPQF